MRTGASRTTFKKTAPMAIRSTTVEEAEALSRKCLEHHQRMAGTPGPQGERTGIQGKDDKANETPQLACSTRQASGISCGVLCAVRGQVLIVFFWVGVGVQFSCGPPLWKAYSSVRGIF